MCLKPWGGRIPRGFRFSGGGIHRQAAHSIFAIEFLGGIMAEYSVVFETKPPAWSNSGGAGFPFSRCEGPYPGRGGAIAP